MSKRQHLLFKSQYDDAFEHENNMIEEERTQIHSLAESVNGEITFISSRLDDKDDKDAEIESITEVYQSIKYDFNQIRIYYEKLLEYQK